VANPGHYPRQPALREIEPEYRHNFMSFTKSQLVDAIAEKAGVEKKTAETMLDCLARLAYENAQDEFTVPGIGKLVVVDRKARTARNPQTGVTIQIPAKKALKFRIAKAAKDAILGAEAPPTSSPTANPPPTP
jgi:DNA-binding protein HU-beta